MSEDFQKQPDRPEIPAWFTYGTLGVLLMIIGALAAITIQPRHIFRTGVTAELKNGFIHLDTQTSRYLIRSSVPIIDKNAGEDDPFTFIRFNWADIYWRIAANLRNPSPQEILKAQFPFMAFIKPRVLPIKVHYPIITNTKPEIPEPEETIPNKPASNPALTKEPEIFIFHTHTSESYIPVSGKDHQFNQKGDIVQVGRYLQRTLEDKYGIKCIHSEEIHDQYPFRDSYKRSQITINNTLKEYPSIKVVLDVHRDATPGLAATCTIKGEKTSTILIVVGSDKMGLPHPHWRENLDFANQLTENMNIYYPGLSNGIVVSNARYNQHLNNHSLIIEFGDQNSTLDDIYRAIDRFAEILVLTI